MLFREYGTSVLGGSAGHASRSGTRVPNSNHAICIAIVNCLIIGNRPISQRGLQRGLSQLKPL